MRQSVLKSWELHQLQEFGYSVANFRLVETSLAAHHLQTERDIFEDRHVAEECVALENKADVALLDLQPGRINSVEIDVPVIREVQTGTDPHQGGFAGS